MHEQEMQEQKKRYLSVGVGKKKTEYLICAYMTMLGSTCNNFWKENRKKLAAKLVLEEVPTPVFRLGNIETQYQPTAQKDSCDVAQEYTKHFTAFTQPCAKPDKSNALYKNVEFKGNIAFAMLSNNLHKEGRNLS